MTFTGYHYNTHNASTCSICQHIHHRLLTATGTWQGRIQHAKGLGSRFGGTCIYRKQAIRHAMYNRKTGITHRCHSMAIMTPQLRYYREFFNVSGLEMHMVRRWGATLWAIIEHTHTRKCLCKQEHIRQTAWYALRHMWNVRYR